MREVPLFDEKRAVSSSEKRPFVFSRGTDCKDLCHNYWLEYNNIIVGRLVIAIQIFVVVVRKTT